VDDLTLRRLAVAALILEKLEAVPFGAMLVVHGEAGEEGAVHDPGLPGGAAVRVPVDLFLDLPWWVQERGVREQRNARSPATYDVPIPVLARYALGRGA
jgi:hypothetical protein